MTWLALLWKFRTWIGAGLVVLAAVGLWGAWVHRGHELSAARQAANVAKAQTTVAQNQNAAQQQASNIVDHGRAKADVTVHIQQENEHALLSAPGAQQSVDPQLYGRFIDGLCRYPQYAGDSRCFALRPADPAKPANASPAGPDAGSYGWGDRSVRGSTNGPT
jgi:type II secretory pathway pseudopilin PulG